MAKKISSLWVGLGGDISGLSKSFTAAIAPVRALTGAVGAAGAKIAAITGIGAAIGAGFAAVGSIGKGFSLAADFEQASVAMEVMLGSADAAKTVLKDLTSFAASTPFEMPELVDSTKMLIAFGVEQKKLLPTLNAIGDVASAVGAPITELSELYGKAKTQGTLFAQDINQLTGRGIPIIQELAKQFGVAESGVKDLVASGSVNFGHLEKAFASMTGSGGKFAGMMEKQSGTLKGLTSTLSDTIGLTLMGMAQRVIDAFGLKDAIKSLTAGLGRAGDVAQTWVGRIAPIVKGVAATIYQTFVGVYNAVAPVVGRVFTVVSNVFAQVVGFVRRQSDSFIGALTGIGAAIFGPAVIGAVIAIGTTVAGLAAALASPVGLIIAGFAAIGASIGADRIKAAFAAVYAYVAPIMTTLGGVIAANWQSVLASTINAATTIVGFVKSAFGIVLDIAGVMWSGVAAAWDWGVSLITGKTGGFGLTIKGTFEFIATAARWMADTVSTALGILEFGFNNWRDVVAYAATSALLPIVRFGNQIQYVFTEVIPAVLTWFTGNWRDIFTDVFNFTATVFTNLASNVVSIVSNIPGLISGSVSFGDLWTPLTTGFESSLKELPKIAERQIGGLEGELAATSAALEKSLAKGLAQHLADRQAKAEKAAAAIGKGIGEAVKPPGKVDAPKVETPDPLKFQVAPLIPTIDPKSLTVTVKPELGKAVMAGSAEAQALRFAAPTFSKPGTGGLAAPAAGAMQQPQVPTAAATASMKDVATEFIKRLLDASLEQTGVLKEIARSVSSPGPALQPASL